MRRVGAPIGRSWDSSELRSAVPGGSLLEALAALAGHARDGGYGAEQTEAHGAKLAVTLGDGEADLRRAGGPPDEGGDLVEVGEDKPILRRPEPPGAGERERGDA